MKTHNSIQQKPRTLLIMLAGLVFASLHLVASQAFAKELPGPKVHISKVIDEAKSMVTQPNVDTSDKEFRAKFETRLFSIFDFKEMARRSLGKNWKLASAQEQKDFIELFSKMLSKTYLNRVINGFPNSTIEYGEEKVVGKKASLKSKVVSDGENIKVLYRLRHKDGAWFIYDIIIENVSLVANYRSEFAGIVRKEKMSGLISKLADKLTQSEH